MMPSITFSRPCRSTLNGICAASGKLGALLGSVIFLPLARWLGNDRVMLICAVVSGVAAIMTMALEESPEHPDIKRVSSEGTLLSLGTKDNEAHTLVKTGSMACIFDKY